MAIPSKSDRMWVKLAPSTHLPNHTHWEWDLRGWFSLTSRSEPQCRVAWLMLCRCRRLTGCISRLLQSRGEGGWASCSHAEIPDKEEEMLFLLDFGTKDWQGDCCTLCCSWLVLLLPHSGFHGMLQAVAEWSQLNKLPQVRWASLAGWGLALSPSTRWSEAQSHKFISLRV